MMSNTNYWLAGAVVVAAAWMISGNNNSGHTDDAESVMDMLSVENDHLSRENERLHRRLRDEKKTKQQARGVESEINRELPHPTPLYPKVHEHLKSHPHTPYQPNHSARLPPMEDPNVPGNAPGYAPGLRGMPVRSLTDNKPDPRVSSQVTRDSLFTPLPAMQDMVTYATDMPTGPEPAGVEEDLTKMHDNSLENFDHHILGGSTALPSLDNRSATSGIPAPMSEGCSTGQCRVPSRYSDQNRRHRG